MIQGLGDFLKKGRAKRGMGLAELARATRIPHATLVAIEEGRFDDLPGEVFVRGFLKAYAQAVGLAAEDVLARYTASRRHVVATPLPQLPTKGPERPRRFGVAVAFVLLLILFTLAVSIVLKPRGRDLPPELSTWDSAPDRAPSTALSLT